MNETAGAKDDKNKTILVIKYNIPATWIKEVYSALLRSSLPPRDGWTSNRPSFQTTKSDRWEPGDE